MRQSNWPHPSRSTSCSLPHDCEPSLDLLRDLRVAVDRANTAIAGAHHEAQPDGRRVYKE